MAESSYGRRSNQASDFGARTTNQLARVADEAEGVASRLAAQGRDASERMQEVAGNFKGALETSVRDQPMATLAAATIVGFVLGALWRA